MLNGSARLRTGSGAHQLEANQTGAIGSGGTVTTTNVNVALTAPGRGAKRYFHQAPGPIVLGWAAAETDPVAVEVAHDRAFGEVIESTPATGGTRTFQPALAGTFWWRVVDASGIPRSETRKFDLIEDLAPIPSSPIRDEQIDTAPRAIPFTWSRVENAPLYRVEISKLDDFSTLAFSAQVASNSLWVRDQFPEGQYHWRVRTVQAERGESPFSEPRSFILIDKPLPAAPELIDSALEVMGGKKRQR